MSRLARWCLRPATSAGEVSVGDDGGVRGHWPWMALGGVALLLVASAALATRPSASPPSSPALPRIDARAATDLPLVDLGWVRMRDHFTTTLGPDAGHGAALGELLVAADTTLAPGKSFAVHRHGGLDVVTIVLDGTLAIDEGGRSLELPAGTVQALASGAGVMHAEANHGDRPVRFVQLWLAAKDADRAPASEQVGAAAGAGLAPLPLTLLAPEVLVRRATLGPGESASLSVARGRVAYVLCAGGDVELDTVHLGDGDGATLADGRFAATAGGQAASLIVVDLPAPPDRG